MNKLFPRTYSAFALQVSLITYTTLKLVCLLQIHTHLWVINSTAIIELGGKRHAVAQFQRDAEQLS